MQLAPHLLATFRQLLDAAIAAGEFEPTAMTLASSDEYGRISARTVLLKDADPEGFVFYTNTLSRKGKQLGVHPQAALLFLWKAIANHVQVRIEGRIASVTDAEADAYFASRPRESQIGAWASLQSEELDERATLERRIAEYTKQYEGGPVPRPPHWSGYRLEPDLIEFWYGRPFRLHERHQWAWKDGQWREALLYP